MVETYENEKVFPLKKRKSIFSLYQEENKKKQDEIEGERVVPEKAIQEGKMAGEKILPEASNIEDKEIQEIVENKKDMGIQVSNPISLIAIAASWLADAEENQVIVPSVEIKPMPQAYAVKDALIRESEGQSVLDIYGGDEDIKEGSMTSPIVDELNGILVKSNERKRFTKPRSNIARRPKTCYPPLTQYGEPEKELFNEADDTSDLFSTVKRSSRMAATTGGSRCSRVNGKGWRCSQLANDGYALCDHHLGRQERLCHMGNLGSIAAPKKKPRRKKADKRKIRSMKSILAGSVPI